MKGISSAVKTERFEPLAWRAHSCVPRRDSSRRLQLDDAYCSGELDQSTLDRMFSAFELRFLSRCLRRHSTCGPQLIQVRFQTPPFLLVLLRRERQLQVR